MQEGGVAQAAHELCPHGQVSMNGGHNKVYSHAVASNRLAVARPLEQCDIHALACNQQKLQT
jgi:hypothetical protein